MSNKILIIMRQAPYGSTLAREALEAALAFGSFEQQVSLLFMDDGVYQLIPDHQPRYIEQKNHAAMLLALPMFDITDVYIEHTSLIGRGLQTITLPANSKVISHQQISQLFSSHDKILSF